MGDLRVRSGNPFGFEQYDLPTRSDSPTATGLPTAAGGVSRRPGATVVLRSWDLAARIAAMSSHKYGGGLSGEPYDDRIILGEMMK